MPVTLNLTDIQFDELRIFRVKQPDATYQWFASVGYDITTTQGQVIHRDRTQQLAGARLTSASTFLTNIYNDIKTLEGI